MVHNAAHQTSMEKDNENHIEIQHRIFEYIDLFYARTLKWLNIEERLKLNTINII